MSTKVLSTKALTIPRLLINIDDQTKLQLNHENDLEIIKYAFRVWGGYYDLDGALIDFNDSLDLDGDICVNASFYRELKTLLTDQTAREEAIASITEETETTSQA